MKILVDADACPVKEIVVKIAKKNGISVTMILDTAHVYNDGYSQVLTVDKGVDSVDFTLMGLVQTGDVVVTQDYGLAAMALSKNAKVINQNGLIYTTQNIDQLLMNRYLCAKARKARIRTKGPSKRTKNDDLKFELAFEQLLSLSCENDHL